MLRAWIEIKLDNGERFKYVRDVVGDSAGVDSKYYGYGDTVGDTFIAQSLAGQVKSDFDSLVTSLGDSRLSFPESAGDTYILTRVNYDMPLQQQPGSTGDVLTIPNIYWTVTTDSVSTIAVVEEWIPPTDVTIP